MNEELPVYDHRRIGREQNLFHVQEDAAGSVFWHPRGYALFRTVETYIRERLARDGYEEVRTPQVVSSELWKKSGHWDKFRKNMFMATDADPVLPETDNISELMDHDVQVANVRTAQFIAPKFAIKPMNCPCHVQIFNANTVSYRNLPMRMAEFGICHRNEPSGALHGIMRVRQFTQDDAHIFCTEDQIEDETKRFCDLLMSVYKDFGFTEIAIGFSTRPDVRAGTDEQWDRAESALDAAVKAAGLVATLQPGEGAFYGPKLEFALTDLRGRKWQCGTLQLDFVLPERLGAQFTDQDGQRKAPVMLHRAILGSLERFIGIVIEHYEGRLPAWLSPTQYVIVPVKPDQPIYARMIAEDLAQLGLRGHVDERDENFNIKVKEHLSQHASHLIVVGPRDEANNQMSVRIDGGPNLVWPRVEGIDRIAENCGRPTLDQKG